MAKFVFVAAALFLVLINLQALFTTSQASSCTLDAVVALELNLACLPTVTVGGGFTVAKACCDLLNKADVDAKANCLCTLFSGQLQASIALDCCKIYTNPSIKYCTT